MQAAHSLLVHTADFCLPEFCLENAEWISIQVLCYLLPLIINCDM